MVIVETTVWIDYLNGVSARDVHPEGHAGGRL